MKWRNDPEFRDMPDANTLSSINGVPLLVRCRDLNNQVVNGTLDDILYNVFRKSEIETSLLDPLIAYLRNALADGTALLLIDGLDEVPDPRDRSALSRQMNGFHRLP